jgi:hypothetical protein
VVAVPYDEISSAFEFVGSAAPTEHSAYISLDTGRIYFVSELASMDEEVPDDFETSDRYIAVPHKNELELGKTLALQFTAHEMSDAYERVESIFRYKGAYGRFKDLLETKGLLENWYRFESGAHDKALREWCAENGIQVVDNRTQPAA